MILTLRANTLTRYATENGYATSREIPVEGDLATLMQGLLAWLSQNLAAGESVSDVVLESVGSVPTGWTEPDENGTQEPLGFRAVISAAVSVTAPAGSRTFVVSSETLPEALRDSLLAAWATIES